MAGLKDTEISKAIIASYTKKLTDHIVSDVIIVGAGPSGMVAAHDLAGRGLRVAILEKRLSPGGGVWGGGMWMSEAVVQDEAVALLDEFGIRHAPAGDGIHTVDSVELAAALTVRAVQAGAVLLNLTDVEDVAVADGCVNGVVANRTMIGGKLPVDPVTFCASAVIDGTGHDACVVNALRKRGLLTDAPAGKGVEMPMNADEGERFVVEQAQQVYPGLWVAGMSVCAVLGGPRMGPIFGGMLLSGRRVATLIADELGK